MVLETNVNIQGAPRKAELELNFGSMRWSLKNGKNALPGVVYSDQGPFQTQGWGVVWLLDGMAGRQTSTVMIIHDAPMNEGDKGHTAGSGRLFAPSNPALKDGQIRWKINNQVEEVMSPLRQIMVDVLKANVPKEVLTSDDPAFKALLGIDTKWLFNNYWEPEHDPKWTAENPYNGAPPKNTTFTTCNMTLGELARRFARKAGKRVGTWLNRGPLQLDNVNKDVPGCWIRSGDGLKPKVGDFYSKPLGKQKFGHVGIIGDFTADGAWTSVDGGQGGYNSCKFDKIAWAKRGAFDYTQVNGWIDLDTYFK